MSRLEVARLGRPGDLLAFEERSVTLGMDLVAQCHGRIGKCQGLLNCIIV